MAAVLRMGMMLLDQVQNVGQVCEIGQNHVFHLEDMRWTRREFRMGTQSLRIDALDHAKEEIRSHYNTYMIRIETLLLVMTLIWPFALNTIQFSDPFVPETEVVCPKCVEAQYPWLVGSWIFFLVIILILPFWGILMLIRYKLKMDSWLEYSLGRLNRERRKIAIVKPPPPKEPLRTTLSRRLSQTITNNRADDTDHEDKKDSDDADNTEKIVCKLVDIVTECQEYLAMMWTTECGWLVGASTRLLWVSAIAALLLTSISMWIWMVNRGGAHEYYSVHFAVIIAIGCIGPVIYVLCQQRHKPVFPPDGDTDGDSQSLFPLTSSLLHDASSSNDLAHAGSLRRVRSSPEFIRQFS
eukprot:gnl/TRDRNA2_/TRDRNA2_29780_c0_seq1.p1 gnl/TRDRNA2_/TRDRNA2_29780_c0~~gnl/TRDRNA2_/TRDRNA2_29780_c0_seq1.p1  ORF type:complete len:354 (-),score=29.28 gnl/TRDRNA2_/TRDRNA2_29780_c0_seq1:98-1159(-)